MYKRILVAVDGSDTSGRALDEALELAKALGAQLRIVHVVDQATLDWDAEYATAPDIWGAMTRSGRDILDKATTAASDAGIEADAQLIEIITIGQRTPQVVADAADAWPADLIVLGTHGRRGLSHVFLGSVAEGIVRVATKPVLLVRGQ